MNGCTSAEEGEVTELPNTEQVMQFGDVKIKLHWNEDGTALYPVELDIGDGFTWYVTSKKPKGYAE